MSPATLASMLEDPGLAQHYWRVGRKVGRTIYAMGYPGTMASTNRDDDPLIGVMDTPELATEVVRAHNLNIVWVDGVD